MRCRVPLDLTAGKSSVRGTALLVRWVVLGQVGNSTPQMVLPASRAVGMLVPPVLAWVAHRIPGAAVLPTGGSASQELHCSGSPTLCCRN